jgi:hypothetical protein
MAPGGMNVNKAAKIFVAGHGGMVGSSIVKAEIRWLQQSDLKDKK